MMNSIMMNSIMMNSMIIDKYRQNPESKGNGGVPPPPDESGTKQKDEDIQFDEIDAVQNKSCLGMTNFEFEGVRFTPKVIEFVDAFEGKQFAVKMKIQNVGKHPVSVRIGEPSSFIFQIKKPSRRVKFLAAGSSITRTVTYSYHNDDLVQRSQIPVYINGHLVDYPIVVKRAIAEIDVQPTKLDFQVVNLGASAKTMMLTIRNTGGKRTKFEIDVGKNDLDLVVNPIRGTIAAKSQVTTYIEMMGLSEGEFYKEIWVTTTEMPIRVPVLVEVVRPRLEIVHPNVTEDFTLVNFKPTFIGTQKIESFVVKNYSAQATLFVIVGEVNGELRFLKYARSMNPTFDMYLVTAEEGRLEPFESRVCTVVFRPKPVKQLKGWHEDDNDKKKKTQWEHIVFFRVNRVHCVERKELSRAQMRFSAEKNYTKMESIISLPLSNGPPKIRRTSDLTDKDSAAKVNIFLPESISQEEKILRLCLHGKAIEPEVLIQPSSLDFGEICMDQPQYKVVKITNESIIAFKYSIKKTTYVEVSPTEGWLNPDKSHELSVVLTPRAPGIFDNLIEVIIYAKSDVVFEDDESIKQVDLKEVPLKFICKVNIDHEKPSDIDTDTKNKITCLNEVVQCIKHISPEPLFEVKRKSISIKEKQGGKKSKNTPYIGSKRTSSAKEEPLSVTIARIFGCFPPEEPPISIRPLVKDRKLFHKEFIEFVKEMKAEMVCSEEDGCDVKKLLNKKSLHPRQALVPLSPIFLSNINVEPKFINFSAVAVNNMVYETLTISNSNLFSISIRFIPGKSAVSVLQGDIINIPPMFTKNIQVAFQTKDLGRYYGFLDYVINGSHEFKITISALVTPKTLVVNANDLKLKFGVYPHRNAFQPRTEFVTLENMLQTPVKYHWLFPTDTVFLAQVTEGEVPPRSKIITEIILDLQPRKSFCTESNLVFESGGSESIRMKYPLKKVSVHFLESAINMEDIPLNLPTKVKPIIQNACYHDVVFEVLNWMPMPGVVVEPKQGIIKARSFFFLDIKVQIPVIMKFSFEVLLNVHFLNKIAVKICGRVVVPVIRLKPTELIMRKICAQSFDTIAVCVENAGTTPAELVIDFKGCPEYKVVDDKNKLYLPPQKSSKLLIQFEPKDVARYVFYLPIIINKILGPPMMQEPATEYLHFYLSAFENSYFYFGDVFKTSESEMKIPCVCINCTVSPSLLKISSLQIRFHPVSDSHIQYEPEKITISNEFQDVVTFCIRNDDLGEANESPFTLIPLRSDNVEQRMKAIKATLKKGESLVLKASFSPKKHGTYSINVPIFVRGYNNGLVYNFINMRGEWKSPKLYPECNEIHFPPLPLDVGCEVVLTIYAENYSSNDIISCLLWDTDEGSDSKNSVLDFSWLSDPLIKTEKESHTLQVQLNFRSSKPVSVRSFLVFMDSFGNYCSVLLTAISDNSSATTHAFLATKPNKYRLVRDQPPVLKWTDEDEGHPLHNTSASNLHIDKAPRLVIQVTKSMSRPTQLNFVSLNKTSTECKVKGSNSTVHLAHKIFSRSESYIGTRRLSNGPSCKKSDHNDVTHPGFPTHENIYGKHMQETLTLVERWMFEVIMECDQYLVIPDSFQNIKEHTGSNKRYGKKKMDKRERKDFLDFLGAIIEQDVKKYLPSREQYHSNCASETAVCMEAFFAKILYFLQSQGCHLPHVKAEYLLDYESYLNFNKVHEMYEIFKWKTTDLDKVNSFRVLRELQVSAFSNVRSRTDKEYDNEKENSSTLVSKDSWKKNLMSSLNSMDDERQTSNQDKLNEIESPGLPRQVDSLKHFVDGKEFIHQIETFDRITFEARSKQAWLDIVIQVFRNFVLPQVTFKCTIPQVTVIEPNERIVIETGDVNISYEKAKSLNATLNRHAAADNNLYTTQERILLAWLNHHIDVQKEKLWQCDWNSSGSCKIVNNFDKDLADSVALISVTASHCPYIVEEFFSDVFMKPDSINKAYHNAAKLVLAWRKLNIGMTVETANIVKPNTVFMLMLVTHLYEVLPPLHPKYLICFTAPLTAGFASVIDFRSPDKVVLRCYRYVELHMNNPADLVERMVAPVSGRRLNTKLYATRTFVIKNESPNTIYYEPIFLGAHDGVFRLKENTTIELKPNSFKDITIHFIAKKIKKVSATLILSGSVVSPNFGRDLTFYLEGEPSELINSEKFIVHLQLYQVLNKKLNFRPPYEEPTMYEIWYTNQQPEYKENAEISNSIKPWSKIWNRKVSRRVFLNKGDVSFDGKDSFITLDITFASFTEVDRAHWLLFRSEVGDFLVHIQTKVKPRTPLEVITCYYSGAWHEKAECICTGSCLTKAKGSINACPLLTELNIPTRNEGLWEALLTMFLKTLHPQEKAFWTKHFETNIGLCLILWLLGVEEEERAHEFVHVIATKVLYFLKIEPQEDKIVVVPEKIEIPDVRLRSKISIPIHIGKGSPPRFKLTLTMTSENKKEIRMYRVQVRVPKFPDPIPVAIPLVQENSNRCNKCEPYKAPCQICKRTNPPCFHKS